MAMFECKYLGKSAEDALTEAKELGSFADPGAAIDFAQEEVRRLNALGVAADYVDPPDDLVGTG